MHLEQTVYRSRITVRCVYHQGHGAREMTTVKVKLLTPTARVPAYATPGAAGMDLT